MKKYSCKLNEKGFLEGTILESFDVIYMFPSIDNDNEVKAVYNKNSDETKASSHDKSIYLLQRFECSCTQFQATNFFFSVHPHEKYQFINVKTP